MAQYFSPKTVTNGLIAYLDPGNPRSYSGSGTTIIDLTGNGNNGTLYNGEFVSSGPGSYLRNSGNVSGFLYIDVAHSTTLNNAFTVTSGGWTIEELIWTNSVVYPEADAPGVASSPAYTAGSTGFDWNHGIQTTTQMRFGQSSNTSGAYEDDVSISIPSSLGGLNVWRHRTIIWDRGNNKNILYVNGSFASSASTPGTAGTAIYDGGGITFGTLYGWKHFGRRGPIRIYNRILGDAEISQNFSSLQSRYGI